MRLERVHIENYRSVRRLTIDLDDVTTIIGEHDCGKSSLISAIATVLDPARGAAVPVFTTSDFHVADGSGDARARSLSITIWLRHRPAGERVRRDSAKEDSVPVPVPARDRFALRVQARRTGERDPETRVTVLGSTGTEIAVEDAVTVLDAVRHRAPALVIRWRAAAQGPAPVRGGLLRGSGSRVTDVFRALSKPGAVLQEEISSVMDEVRQVAGTIAEQLVPTRERPRSADDLADTPHAFVTDLGEALEADAGPHRQVALLLMVGALLESLPPAGLAPGAEPILLFDGVEEGLHPTWLAAVSSLAAALPFQQVITTHSGDVLSWTPLRSLRRLVRTKRGVQARFVGARTLSRPELRRATYHLRLNRGGSLFARCWVLVEGETEAWMVPEFARLCGIEFASDGIRCVEFAQCGIAPLVKLANALRIAWVLLADGDRAGTSYVRAAEAAVRHGRGEQRVVQLDAPDIEHYLFRHGFANVIARAAGRRKAPARDAEKRRVGRLIHAATHAASKPGLALAILEAANRRGAASVPPAMRKLVGIARDVARAS